MLEKREGIARNRSKWNRPFVPSPDRDLWIITASMYGIEAGFRNISYLKLRDIGPLDRRSGIRLQLCVSEVETSLILLAIANYRSKQYNRVHMITNNKASRRTC